MLNSIMPFFLIAMEGDHLTVVSPSKGNQSLYLQFNYKDIQQNRTPSQAANVFNYIFHTTHIHLV